MELERGNEAAEMDKGSTAPHPILIGEQAGNESQAVRFSDFESALDCGAIGDQARYGRRG